MEQHVRILSVLFIIFGILGMIAALLVLVVGVGTAATILSQDTSSEGQVGAAWAGGCITIMAGLLGIVSIPSIIAGWGLSRKKAWSRILTIIIAILSLPHIPIGTAIGVYALVIMFNDETARVLTE